MCLCLPSSSVLHAESNFSPAVFQRSPPGALYMREVCILLGIFFLFLIFTVHFRVFFLWFTSKEIYRRERGLLRSKSRKWPQVFCFLPLPYGRSAAGPPPSVSCCFSSLASPLSSILVSVVDPYLGLYSPFSSQVQQIQNWSPGLDWGHEV